MSLNVKPSGVTAGELAKRAVVSGMVETINTIVNAIDGTVEAKHAAGYSTTTYELPVNFPFQNVSKKDAQTLVYSELIKIYDAKGFKVAIALGQKPYIQLSWMNGINSSDLQRRHDIIRRHT